VATGFQHGARVVAAAATIMISVFAGFVLGDDFIKQVGFALAVAVFIDAFVVRMTIVPAVLTLLGERAWWLPRWLDRILPDVDVEGEKLRRHLEPAARLEELEPAHPGA
jgi:putative drug exporter of the RND superfamily